MSTLPSTVMVDVAAFPRWYRCVPCDVTWRDTDSVCWSCESDSEVVLHYPPVGKDLASERFEEPASAGTPLTRFGPNVATG